MSSKELLELAGLQPYEVTPAIIYALDDERYQLDKPRGHVVRAMCWLTYHLSILLPGWIALRRVAWSCQADRAVLAIATGLRKAYRTQLAGQRALDEQRAIMEQVERQQQLTGKLGPFASFTLAMQRATKGAGDLKTAFEVGILTFHARRCVALAIACDDYSTEDSPPPLNTPTNEAEERYRLFLALSAPGDSAADTPHGAHGAQETVPE